MNSQEHAEHAGTRRRQRRLTNKAMGSLFRANNFRNKMWSVNIGIKYCKCSGLVVVADSPHTTCANRRREAWAINSEEEPAEVAAEVAVVEVAVEEVAVPME